MNRFAVLALPAVQQLGARRTSYVRRSTAVPRAVDELHNLLVDMLAPDLTSRRGSGATDAGAVMHSELTTVAARHGA